MPPRSRLARAARRLRCGRRRALVLSTALAVAALATASAIAFPRVGPSTPPAIEMGLPTEGGGVCPSDAEAARPGAFCEMRSAAPLELLAR